MEAIAVLLSIARLPPGHDPGACYGVATAAQQRWHLAIRHFGLFGGPLAAANDWRTSEPTNDTCARPSGRDDAAGARPGHGDHGGHGRPRRSRPVTAGHGGHGRPRPSVSDAGSRPRRHEPGAHGTGQGAHGAVRT